MFIQSNFGGMRGRLTLIEEFVLELVSRLSNVEMVVIKVLLIRIRWIN